MKNKDSLGCYIKVGFHSTPQGYTPIPRNVISSVDSPQCTSCFLIDFSVLVVPVFSPEEEIEMQHVCFDCSHSFYYKYNSQYGRIDNYDY